MDVHHLNVNQAKVSSVCVINLPNNRPQYAESVGED